jgi:hypothetical protein
MANVIRNSKSNVVGLRKETVKTAQRVLKQILNHPGASRGELVGYCHLAPEQVSRSLFTLKHVNAVKVKGSYRWARYWGKSNFSFA